MTDAELDRINTERRRRGLPPLTRTQATTAVVSAPYRHEEGFNSTDFLIGYATGIPMPSVEGIIGSMMHSPSAPDPSPSHCAPDPSPSYDSGGSCGGSDGGDSGGSDSGGSCGGSDDGGGGGGE